MKPWEGGERGVSEGGKHESWLLRMAHTISLECATSRVGGVQGGCGTGPLDTPFAHPYLMRWELHRASASGLHGRDLDKGGCRIIWAGDR